MNQVVWKFIRPVFFVSNILGMFPLNRLCKLNPGLLTIGLIWPLIWGYSVNKVNSFQFPRNFMIFRSYKLIFSFSTFLVTGCLALANRRELDRILTKISKIVDELEVNIPHSSFKSLGILIFYPFGIYYMQQTWSAPWSLDLIIQLTYIHLPSLQCVLPMLRFGAGVTLGNHCLRKLVEKVKIVEDPYRLRRLLCIHNSLAREMFRLNLIYSFEILLFVAFMFFTTMEKIHRALILGVYHDYTLHVLAWIIYTYFALQTIISPCVKSQYLDKSFNNEVVQFVLRSHVVNFNDIKYHFVLKNEFIYTANFCFNLDQSLMPKMLGNGIMTLVMLNQLDNKMPIYQDIQ